ncbi:PREDICTED: D(5)-like dopamine receptor, partial [Nicrophorus vespilloides]|uniref:D(5)-like dopamine receptor n=1 Tax=Nicrophorus vespilloides TaxID=110193 RepID=A0ABM1MFZ2_NICVS
VAVIISVCWFAGTVVGFLPLMGWHKGPAENGRCFFLGVMEYDYLVFLYVGTIITPALLLLVFYAHIYHVVLRQLKRIVTIDPGSGSKGRSSGGTMLRMLGAAQKREVKATQNLSIIVLFFMICWIPLYTINCTLAFCKDCKVNSTLMLLSIILSHLNSAGNPLLYAYHLRDFRAALKSFICGLFGIGVSAPPATANNNNFSHYRLQSLREAGSNMSLSRNRLIAEKRSPLPPPPTPPPSKLSALMNNSVAALAAAASDGARDIWRISEISEGDNRCSSVINRVDEEDIDEDGEDDVFLDVEPRPPEENLIIPSVTVQRMNNLSTSSPQLSRNLFLVETEMNECRCRPAFMRSVSNDNREASLIVTGDFIHSPAKSLKLSPFKVVGELLKTGKHPRSCSLSDDPDNSRPKNGYIPENHSSGY